MSAPRIWEAFAEETGDPNFPFRTITDWEPRLAMSGVPESKMVTVHLIEDPEGDMLGWIYTGEEDVVMVQHKRLFSIQFTYGVDAELARGRGTTVPLRVEKIGNLHP